MRGILVGVDGSAESERALRWAAHEARIRDADLEVVYAYHDAPAWQAYALEGAPVAYLDSAALEESARAAGEHARRLVDQLVSEVETPGLRVEGIAVADPRPASALVERSKDSELLVVGSRGRGGFTGLLLGSVSQQCATHAQCPVVIVGSRQSS